MRCKDIEEMVTKSCGTVGWSAPEVELDENKPLRAFSPIRADLWSCGKVLQFILERSGETKGSFSKVIDKLMDDEPKCRPLLHEIVDDKADFWVSNRLQLVRIHGLNKFQCTTLGKIVLKDLVIDV